MARRVNRGEIWMYRFRAPDKRRPVVVLTRDDAIEHLHTVMVAPVTSTVRGSPGEVILGPDHGLKRESAANLDHVQTVERARLTAYIGTLPADRMLAICRALRTATGCDE